MTIANETTLAPHRLKQGFADAVFDSQATFRSVLTAMSYAGRSYSIGVAGDGPQPLYPATVALSLTLFDFDTSIWLDGHTATDEVREFLRFHCGCPISSVAQNAQFGIVYDVNTMPSLEEFALGEDRYPDRSTTLLVQVPSLTEGPSLRWSGPGIKDSAEVKISGLPERFADEWSLNHEMYPLGVDIIFISGSTIVGLPRGIRIED